MWRPLSACRVLCLALITVPLVNGTGSFTDERQEAAPQHSLTTIGGGGETWFFVGKLCFPARVAPYIVTIRIISNAAQPSNTSAVLLYKTSKWDQALFWTGSCQTRPDVHIQGGRYLDGRRSFEGSTTMSISVTGSKTRETALMVAVDDCNGVQPMDVRLEVIQGTVCMASGQLQNANHQCFSQAGLLCELKGNTESGDYFIARSRGLKGGGIVGIIAGCIFLLCSSIFVMVNRNQ